MPKILSDGTCHFPHPEEPLIYCQLEPGHYPRTPHQSGDDQWWTVSRPDPALVTMSRMDYYTLLGYAAAGDHGDAVVNAEGEAIIHKIIDRVKARNG